MEKREIFYALTSDNDWSDFVMDMITGAAAYAHHEPHNTLEYK